jgi:folate-binding protein YgfZ
MLDRLGKIQAEVAVVADGVGFALVVLGGDPELVKQHMKRLIVMEDVELRSVDARLASFHGTGGDFVGLEPRFESCILFEIDELFPDGAVLDMELAPSRFRAALDGLGFPIAGAEAWEALRIARGMPAFGQDFTTADNPGQAGLIESAVSLSKGCYLGQEVVCKLVMRGALRERICRIRFDDAPQVGAEIVMEDPDTSRPSATRIGVVTSVGPKGTAGVWALGRVRCVAIETRAPVWAEQVRGRIEPVTSSEGC